MDNALRRLALLFALALPCHAQGILAPILFGNATAPAATSSVFQGQSLPNLTTSGTNSVAYTCHSSADRLVISTYSNGHADTVTLSDTGGLAASAYHIVNNDSPTGDGTENDWNAACPSSGSNTWTLTSAANQEMVLSITEYSGLAASSGTWGSFSGTESSGAIPASATNVTANALAFVHTFVSHPGGDGSASNPTAAWNWRQPNQGSHYFFDNTGVPAGTVSMTATLSGAGGSPYDGYMLFLPTTGTNSGWNPQLRQSNNGCSTGGTKTVAFQYNVVAGDTIVVGAAQNGGSTPITLLDTVGTIYGSAAVTKSGSGNEIYIWAVPAGGSGANTVSLTVGTGGSYPCLQIQEFSAGVGSTVSDTGGNTTSANPMTWSQVVSAANSVSYAICTQNGISATTTGATFAYIPNGNEALFGTVAGWASVPSTTTVTPAFAMPGSSGNVCASVAFH